MFFGKKTHLPILIFGCLILLIITACNPTGSPFISIQSVTPPPSPKPSLQPSETVTPGTSPTPQAPCFVTFSDPFAFMPDGKRILVRGITGVQLFNLGTMEEESVIKAPSGLNGPVVALSPDGEMFAWALEDGTIQAIRITDHKVLYSIASGQPGLLRLEFSPLGDRLYSASHDGTVKIWDNLGELDHIDRTGVELMNIGISPDGTMLATIPSDGPVTMWSLEAFHTLVELGGSGGYDTSDIAFSPDGQYLAADLITGLYVWRMFDGKQLLGSEDAINSTAVTYSPEGRYLAYSNLNKVVLSSPDGSHTIRTLEGHQGPVFELIFSSDGSTLVSADDAGIRIWHVEDGQLLAIGKSKCP